jgi:uncharacterized protein involved in copper resistance
MDLSQPEPILFDPSTRQPMPKQHQPTDHGRFDVMLHAIDHFQSEGGPPDPLSG